MIKELFLKFFCKFLFRFYCPLKISGQYHIPEGAVMICSNHRSHMDSLVLLYASQKKFNNVGLVAASDYFFGNKKIIPWLASVFLNLVPIDRKRRSPKLIDDFLDEWRKFDKTNHMSMIFFPEGTRGNMRPIKIKRGAAIISKKLSRPIVPAFIIGTEKSLPKGVFLPKPVRLSVYFGEPLLPDNQSDEELTSLLENSILILSEKEA